VLKLRPEKARLIEFVRFAQVNQNQRGEGKPETIRLLSCIHASPSRCPMPSSLPAKPK
jgi:hypothetical protein